MSICPTERRKAANQPEAVSTDELKSLLALTRERFLDRFDVLTPKAVLTQTDTMKAAGMVNGKCFITLKVLVVVVVYVCSTSVNLDAINSINQNFMSYIGQAKIYFIHVKNTLFLYTCAYLNLTFLNMVDFC